MNADAQPPPGPPTRRRWPARLLHAAAAVLVMVAAAPLGAERSRFWDVLTSFVPQLFWASALLGAFAVWRRQLATASVLAVTLALAGARLAPYYQPIAPPTAAGRPALRVCLFNVFRDNRAHDRVVELIRREQPDVAVLQEIDEAWAAAIPPALPDYTPVLSSTLGNEGILVLSRRPIEAHDELALSPKGWPNLRLTLRVGDRRIGLLCAHTLSPTRRPGKWADRNAHLEGIADTMRALAASHDAAVLVADLNVAPWSPHFQRMLARADLRDTRRGRGLQGTWPAPLARLTGVPIDHVLCSQALVATRCQAGAHEGSDHLPLHVDLAWRAEPRRHE